MTKDTSRYIVTDNSQLVEEEADLDQEQHIGPDGHLLTEAGTDEYTRRRAIGRPSLGGRGSSPQVAFRIPPALRERAERVAQQEGTTVSALAREALKNYVAHR
ncbi:MAG: hypothetical protein ACYCZK_07585 [Microbacteriaceae bacterium]